MKRRTDWQKQFRSAVDTASVCRFQYGQHDCATFVARVIDKMCDTDFVLQLRSTYGPYDDELAAHNILHSNGGMLRLITEWLGEPMPVKQARPGDVVLLRNEKQIVVGVIENQKALCAAEVGVAAAPLDIAVCAWRVG